jgi:hypothetical protein
LDVDSLEIYGPLDHSSLRVFPTSPGFWVASPA